MPPSIDLNCDMGEGYGDYRCADDEAMLELVSSANVACGYHAGDHLIMANICRKAKEQGVAIGAHPGHADLWGFGRRNIAISDAELVSLVAYQIGALKEIAALNGHEVTYVKVHGALGHHVADNESAGRALVSLIERLSPRLTLSVIAGTRLDAIASRSGLTVMREIYADRAYGEDGRLAPRGVPGAVIHDVDAAVTNVLGMLAAGAVITQSGRHIPTRIDSVCIHGDTASAIEMARAIRSAVINAGYEVKPFAASTCS